MGFNLAIGDAALVDNGEDSTVPGCETITRPDAPADGVPTDHTNERWPSYGGWGEFCDVTGLGAVMYEGCEWEGEQLTPLMPEHPGVGRITPAHLAYVEAKLANRKRLDQSNNSRADWLLYWMRWAVAECPNPVFVNH